MDELLDFIRQSLNDKAHREGMAVTPQQVEEAAQYYAKAPGNEYRRAFYKQKADQAQQEAQHAQLGGGFGDVAERTVRDVGTGLLSGVTSPLRLGMHIGDAMTGGSSASDFENWIASKSGDSMGGRGLSPNRILGTLQSAVEPAAAMAGSYPMAGAVQKGAGNVLTNVASKFPQSKALQALGTVPGKVLPGTSLLDQGAAVLRAAPRAAATGLAGASGGMPDETFAHGNVGQNLAMGTALGALSATDPIRGVPKLTQAGPKPQSLMGRARGAASAIRSLGDDPFSSAPPQAQPQAPVPTIAPIVPPVTAAPPGAPPAAAPTPAAAPVPPIVSATPSARTMKTGTPGFGGEPVDWAAETPEVRAKAEELFNGLPDMQTRASYFGQEGKVTGEKADKRYVGNLTDAKAPGDLFGHMQRVLRDRAKQALVDQYALSPELQASLVEPKATTPATAPVVAAKVASPSAAVAAAPPPSVPEAVTPPVANTPVPSVQPTVTKQPSARKGKLTPKAPENPQIAANATRIAEIEAQLGGAPAAPATPTASEPGVVTGTPSKRGPRTAASAVTPIGEAPQAPAAAATPASAEVNQFFTAGGWDGMSVPSKTEHLKRLGVPDARAAVMATMPFEHLPAPLRGKVQGDPEIGALMAPKPESPAGGAPSAAKPFRGRRRGPTPPAGKQPPASST